MYTSLAYYVSLLRKDFVDYCNQALSSIGLSQGQINFIVYIGKNPNCSPKELSKAINMDVGHTARTISKLEQENFLIQKQNPKDKRARILQLTDKGEEAFKLGYQLFKEWDEKFLEDFSIEEQEQLYKLMEKLTNKKDYNSYIKK